MEISIESLPLFREHALEGFPRLMATLRAIPLGEPSLLPAWTRAHLATHIARNADSHVRLLEAAESGQLVEQYAGGAEGRAADIERGAARAHDVIIEDVLRSGEALFALWERLPEQVWTRTVGSNRGQVPAWQTVWSRVREIEIHHVDLGGDYRADDWPATFVDALLPQVLEGLPARLEPGVCVALRAGGWKAQAGEGSRVTVEGTRASLLAWMLGRDVGYEVRATEAGTSLPTLKPWG